MEEEGELLMKLIQGFEGKTRFNLDFGSVWWPHIGRCNGFGMHGDSTKAELKNVLSISRF
jgi:hypothetical protein